MTCAARPGPVAASAARAKRANDARPHTRGGRLSGWPPRRLGDVEGAFVLPHALPDKRLFVSTGSGITPIMSMLRSLAAQEQRAASAFNAPPWRRVYVERPPPS